MQDLTLKYTQLLGIIYYDIKLQWRRRSLPVVLWGFLIVMVASTFIGPSSNNTSSKAELTLLTLLIFAPMCLLLVMGLFPAVVAETLPRDHQCRVNTILESLPFSFPFYIFCKLMSVWVTILLLMVLFAVLQWLGIWLRIGPVDLWMYLKTWLLVIAPFALSLSGLSMALASLASTRRRAIFLGGGITLYCIASQILSFSLNKPAWNWLQPFAPLNWSEISYHLLYNYATIHLGQADFIPAPPNAIWPVPLSAFIQFLFVWSIVLLWHHYRPKS